MQFKLCYKDYDFKLTWAAKREFKRETGRGLWSTLQGVFAVANKNKGASTWDLLCAIGEHIDDVDGATLLWVLAKQCNSTLQISEIADACDRVGWRPVDEGSEHAQPYTYVLYDIVLQIDKMYQEEAIKAKKDLCHQE